MSKLIAIALLALCVAACAPAAPPLAPSASSLPPTSVPPAASSAPAVPPPATAMADSSTSLRIESIEDLRAIVNKMSQAEPAQAQATADALYQSLRDAKRIPLVLGQQVVFFYKGNATSMNVHGTFDGWDAAGPGLKGGLIGQTDLWLAQAEAPPASRVEYKLVLNGKDWINDPGNPDMVPSLDTTNNVVALPGFQVTDESALKPGVPNGTIKDLSTQSKALGFPVRYWVYTPAGYEQMKDLPVLYFTDGNDWVDSRGGAAPVVMDNLIAAKRMAPAIGIFISERDPAKPDYNRREDDFSIRHAEYGRFLTEELIPAIDAGYRTKADADHRTIVGVSLGGVMATWLAAQYPDVFHNLAAFSPSMWVFLPEPVKGRFSEAQIAGFLSMKPIVDALTVCGSDSGIQCRAQPLKVFASIGFPDWDVGNLGEIADRLKQKGYSVRWEQVQEGHAWSAWRGLLDEMLTYLEAP